jgi:ribose transport system substrate-binding protein
MPRKWKLKASHGPLRIKAAAAVVGLLMLMALVAGCGNKSSSSTGESTSASSGSSGGGGETVSSGEGGEGTVAIGNEGTPEEMLTSVKEICGEKPTVVGLAWGFEGNAWRKLTRGMLEKYVKECPTVEKFLYTNANLNAQKSISDINSMVAQGVNVLLVYPDFGPAVLPALQAATAKGVKVVPFAVESGPLGGEPGTDYVDAVSENTKKEGETWANWMAKATGEKGKIVFIGGTTGNPTSTSEFEGVQAALKKYPEMEILGNKIYWGQYDVAENQKVMASLLTQYPEIDGVIDDYGGSAVGAIRAFIAAGRPLVPFATADQNNLACEYYKLKKTNPEFQLGTVSSRNWVIYPAFRKGMASYQGTSDPEPSTYDLPIIEDSTGKVSKQMPICESSLSPDAILSTGLKPAELTEILGN